MKRENPKPLKKIYSWLNPTADIRRSRWREKWQNEDLWRVLRYTRLSLVILTCIFIFHISHFFNKDNLLEKFAVGRFLILVLCAQISFFASFHERLQKVKSCRLPLIFMALSFLIFYPYKIHHNVENFLELFLLSLTVLVLSLRLNAIKSTGTYIVIFLPFLLSNFLFNHEMQAVEMSLVYLNIACVFLLRLQFRNELKSFVNNCRLLAKQKEVIASQRDFQKHLKAFLPKVIFERLAKQAKNNHLRLEHIDSATILRELKPQVKNVCCIYSDVRGFTSSTKDINHEYIDAFLLELRQYSNIAESNGGIPRIVGDLIFTYFDYANKEKSLLSAMRTVVLMSKWHKHFIVEKITESFDRYFVVCMGEAVVGNIGGVHSSREISALGRPVNLSARIDELTKSKVLQNILQENRIILSDEVVECLKAHNINLDLIKVNMQEHGLCIRDFSEENCIWALKLSADNLKQLKIVANNEFSAELIEKKIA